MKTSQAAVLNKGTSDQYEPKKYNHLFGMPGFSDKLLSDHFKLYQGYVSNTNTSFEKLQSYTGDESKKTEISEIRRRLGWEMNGMRLHEFYFENLGGKEPLASQTQLSKIFDEHFGGFEKWKKDFVAAGAMRGIGWVVLYQDIPGECVFNMWIEEHNINHLAGGNPLLVMDVFEHAYMTDYGTDKATYITSFFNNIDWGVVEKRYAPANV